MVGYEWKPADDLMKKEKKKWDYNNLVVFSDTCGGTKPGVNDEFLDSV